MKLTAIKKLCVDKRTFVIINTPEGRQWLTDGSNVYPVEGVRIHSDSIPALFDLTPKQADPMQIREVNMIDDRLTIEPQPDTEKLLEDIGAVWYAGELFRVLGSANGLIFVPVATLKPAENKMGALEFYERVNPAGHILIAVYGNMLCNALVCPVNQKTAESIMAQVQAVALQAIRTGASPDAEAAADKAEREAEEAMRRVQERMDLGEDVDPDAGQDDAK